MFSRTVCYIVVLIIVFQSEILEASASKRQKRCIVVQKQSSSRDAASSDDGDDTDDDYRKPQPKEPKPDRLYSGEPVKSADAEHTAFEWIKTKPKRKLNRPSLRNKLIRSHLYN